MSGATPGVKSTHVTFSAHNQTAQQVNEVMQYILGRGGCRTCGRIAVLSVQYLVDPAPELAKSGVVSVNEGG